MHPPVVLYESIYCFILAPHLKETNGDALRQKRTKTDIDSTFLLLRSVPLNQISCFEFKNSSFEL